MFPICGFDWGNPDYNIGILDMSLDDYNVYIGGHITENEDETEYPFDLEWLQKKKTLTHEILDKELELYKVDYKAAGCLFYNIENSKVWVLLQKKENSKYLEDFGGRKECGELYTECAKREVSEESNGILNLEDAVFRGVTNGYAFFTKNIQKTANNYGKRNNDGFRTVAWYDYSRVRYFISPRIPKDFLDGLSGHQLRMMKRLQWN